MIFTKDINEYADYKVLDFVEDEIFRSWVLDEADSFVFYWDKIFKAYPHLHEISEEARKVLQDTKFYFDLEASAIRPYDKHFQKQLSVRLERTATSKNHHTNSSFWKIAACLAFIITLSSLVYLNFSQKTNEFDTGNGEWENIELPDGSMVQLNANSQLSLIGDWTGDGDRVVWLKGEAFFQVKKKLSGNKKFSVVTEDLRIEVFGTSFNVNTRNEQTRVFLEEGEVLLKLDNEQQEIIPGEYLSYSIESKEILDRGVKIGDFQSDWKKGVLKIEDASIFKILDEIEVIYGVDMIISDSTLSKRMGTIAFPVDNLPITAVILERALNVKVEIEGKQVFINAMNPK